MRSPCNAPPFRNPGMIRFPTNKTWLPLVSKWLPLVSKWLPLVSKWLPLVCHGNKEVRNGFRNHPHRQTIRPGYEATRARASKQFFLSTWSLPGVIILTVSAGYQIQRMGLFPFNPPLRHLVNNFDHAKLMEPVSMTLRANGWSLAQRRGHGQPF